MPRQGSSSRNELASASQGLWRWAWAMRSSPVESTPGPGPSPSSSPRAKWRSEEAARDTAARRRAASSPDLQNLAVAGPERSSSSRAPPPRQGPGPAPAPAAGAGLIRRFSRSGSSVRLWSPRPGAGKGKQRGKPGLLHQVACTIVFLLALVVLALAWHAVVYRSVLAQLRDQHPLLGASMLTPSTTGDAPGSGARGPMELEEGTAAVLGNLTVDGRLEAAMVQCKSRLSRCKPFLLRCTSKQRRKRLLASLHLWGKGIADSGLVPLAVNMPPSANDSRKQPQCRSDPGVRRCRWQLRFCRDVSNALQSLGMTALGSPGENLGGRGKQSPEMTVLGSPGEGLGEKEKQELSLASEPHPGGKSSSALQGQRPHAWEYSAPEASLQPQAINCTFFNRHSQQACRCPVLLQGTEEGACKPRAGHLHDGIQPLEEQPRAEGTGLDPFLSDILLTRIGMSVALQPQDQRRPASADAMLYGPGGRSLSALLSPAQTRNPQELAHVFSVRDTPRDRVYQTCSVVGDSSLLLALPVGAAIDAHEAVFRFGGGSTTLAWQRYAGSKTTVRLVTSQHQAHLRESSKESLLFVARRAQDWKAFVRFRQLNVSRKGSHRHHALSPAFLAYARNLVQAALRMQSTSTLQARGNGAQGGDAGSQSQIGAAGEKFLERGAEREVASEPTQSSSTLLDESKTIQGVSGRKKPAGVHMESRAQAEGTRVGGAGSLPLTASARSGDAKAAVPSAEAPHGSHEGQSRAAASSGNSALVRSATSAPAPTPSPGPPTEETRRDAGPPAAPERYQGHNAPPPASAPAAAPTVAPAVAPAAAPAAAPAGAQGQGPRAPPAQASAAEKPGTQGAEGISVKAALESGMAVVMHKDGPVVPGQDTGQPQAEARPVLDTVDAPPHEGAAGSAVGIFSLWTQEGLPAKGDLPVYRPEQDPVLQDLDERVSRGWEGLSTWPLGKGTGEGPGEGGPEVVLPGGFSLGYDAQPDDPRLPAGAAAAVLAQQAAPALSAAAGPAPVPSATDAVQEQGSEAPEELHLDDQGVDEEGAHAGTAEATEGQADETSEAGTLGAGGGPSQGAHPAVDLQSPSAEAAQSSEAQAEGGLTFLLAHQEQEQGDRALAAVGEGGEEITFKLTEAQQQASDAGQDSEEDSSVQRQQGRRRLLGSFLAARHLWRGAQEERAMENASPGWHGTHVRGISQTLRSGMRVLLAAPETPAEGTVSAKLKLRERRRKGKGKRRHRRRKGMATELARGSGLESGEGITRHVPNKDAPAVPSAVVPSEEERTARRASAQSNPATGRHPTKKGRRKKGSSSKPKQDILETGGYPGTEKLTVREPGRDGAEDGGRNRKRRKPRKGRGTRSQRRKALLGAADGLGSATGRAGGNERAHRKGDTGRRAREPDMPLTSESRVSGRDGDVATTGHDRSPREAAEVKDKSEEHGAVAAVMISGDLHQSRDTPPMTPPPALPPPAAVPPPPPPILVTPPPILVTPPPSPLPPASYSKLPAELAQDPTKEPAAQARAMMADLAPSVMVAPPAMAPQSGSSEGPGRAEPRGVTGASAALVEPHEGGSGDPGSAESVLSEEGTVSEAWVALALALNSCQKVSVFGWPIGNAVRLGSSQDEMLQLPQKYSSRCMPTGSTVVSDDHLALKRLADSGILTLGTPCMIDCLSSADACTECVTGKASLPSLLDGLSELLRLPLPEECTGPALSRENIPAWMETGVPVTQ